MTRAFDFVNTDISANPLYSKLRNRFMCGNNCTIGEVMIQKAADDGYRCSADVTSGVRSKSNFRITSEYYITRGNSLPIEEKITHGEKAKKNRAGLFGIIALFAVTAAILIGLVINRVNYVKDSVSSDVSDEITEISD